MSEENAIQLINAFNGCIACKNIDGIAMLLTNDHVFVDSASGVVSGKRQCIRAWQNFFDAFPDYRNIFENITVRGNDVIIVGRSVCADDRLSGPALWTARIRGGLLADWRVYEDTGINRKKLGIETL